MTLNEIQLDSLPKPELSRYEKLNPEIHAGLSKIGKKLHGNKIYHISSTATGGGVAELLRSQIPYEKSLGLDSRWFVIEAPRSFFEITKKIHNLFQGKPGFLSKKEKQQYLEENGRLGKDMAKILSREKTGGIVIIHDPQPLAIREYIPKNFYVISRLHIDLSSPNTSIVEFMRPFLSSVDMTIVSNKDFVKCMPWLPPRKIRIISPAIDPFTDKNRSLSRDLAKEMMVQYGINPDRFTISQISRFDTWKDPLGVIKAYYLAKNKIPELQLVLVGFFEAQDDPESADVFNEVKKHSKADPDIHLFYNMNQLQPKDASDDLFINALQLMSDVVIQASTREGFGLTITEAMWKARPVIARKTSGPMIQIKDGQTGFLVVSPETIAKKIIHLHDEPRLGIKIGKKAAMSVKKKFLMPRFVYDNAKIYQKSLEPVHNLTAN